MTDTDEITRLRAENERLRNELHIAQDWSARVIAGHEEDIVEITRLRAENERQAAELRSLRAALERFACDCEGEAICIGECMHRNARAAIAVALEEAARVCERRFMGDHNREDMEARRCAAAIRALAAPSGALIPKDNV